MATYEKMYTHNLPALYIYLTTNTSPSFFMSIKRTQQGRKPVAKKVIYEQTAIMYNEMRKIVDSHYYSQIKFVSMSFNRFLRSFQIKQVFKLIN